MRFLDISPSRPKRANKRALAAIKNVPPPTITSTTDTMPGISDTTSPGMLPSTLVWTVSRHKKKSNPKRNAVVIQNEYIITGNDGIGIKHTEVAVMGGGVGPTGSGEFVLVNLF
jgi:hypothetical protein